MKQIVMAVPNPEKKKAQDVARALARRVVRDFWKRHAPNIQDTEWREEPTRPNNRVTFSFVFPQDIFIKVTVVTTDEGTTWEPVHAEIHYDPDPLGVGSVDERQLLDLSEAFFRTPKWWNFALPAPVED